VTLRVTGNVPTEELADTIETSDIDAQTGSREVYFADYGWLETAICDRSALVPGQTITAPTILEENGATSIVPPNTEAVVTEAGNIHITL
jgi:N-methylhydantoinase A